MGLRSATLFVRAKLFQGRLQLHLTLRQPIISHPVGLLAVVLRRLPALLTVHFHGKSGWFVGPGATAGYVGWHMSHSPHSCVHGGVGGTSSPMLIARATLL